MLEAHGDVMGGALTDSTNQEPSPTSGRQVQITFVLPDNTKQTTQLARHAPLSQLHRMVENITKRPPGRVMMLAGGQPLKTVVEDHEPWVNALSDALQKEDVVSIICIPRRS